jgi:serine/threonine-protein kinase RsbW
MSDSRPSTDIADANQFIRVDIADAHRVAQTRELFGRWLQLYFDLSPVRHSDLVLAANEALANAAEFAYLRAKQIGAVGLHADYNAAGARLTVTVADNGLWRDPDPHRDTLSRGRGIPLMRALSDHASIETSAEGTEVCMRWNGVRRCLPPTPDR